MPKGLIQSVLQELHDAPTGGHLGFRKTFERVRAMFWYYHLESSEKLWCDCCTIFASGNRPARKAKAALKTYNVGAPLERVGIDIVGPFPRSNQKNKYILTIIDYFLSGW